MQLIIEINKLLTEYIAPASSSFHDPGVRNMLAYKLLAYARENIKGGPSIYGDLYNEAFNKALVKAEADKENFLTQTADSTLFVKLFRNSLNNLTAEKRDRNIGATNYEKQKLASAYLDRLLEKYNIPKTARPSGDQMNNSILEPGRVKAFLDGIIASNPGKYGLSQVEIDDLDRRISLLQSYSAGDASLGENDTSEVSVVDKTEDNTYLLEVKDALRFIKCARAFYTELPKYDKTLDHIAKDYLTLELFQSYPTASYLQLIKTADVVNLELYSYLETKGLDVNLKGWKDSAYAAYLTEQKQKKRTAGTVNKELRKVAHIFESLVEKGTFKTIL